MTMLVLMAAAANAQNSPDVLDMTPPGFDNGVDPAVGVQAQIAGVTVTGGYTYVSGFFSVDPDGDGVGVNQYGQIFWYMYEPYKVSRTATGAKFSQKNHVYVQAYGYDGTTSYSGGGSGTGEDGCKASFAGNDESGDGIYGTGDTAAWSVSCKDKVTSMFGFDSAQAAAFESHFGSDKIKFKIAATLP